jgi:hypothetical protein
MNSEQFQQFMTTFVNLVNGQNALTNALQQQHQDAGNPPPNANPTPKISVKIPTYKGESNENIVVWLLRVQSLFAAQGITDDGTQIYYASTGLEDAAMHWYLNKITAAGNDAAFAVWNTFATEIRTAFQPPNYQQHLRR